MRPVSDLGRILMDQARDLAYAQRDGKPLDRIVSEGAARVAAHFDARAERLAVAKGRAERRDPAERAEFQRQVFAILAERGIDTSDMDMASYFYAGYSVERAVAEIDEPPARARRAGL